MTATVTRRPPPPLPPPPRPTRSLVRPAAAAGGLANVAIAGLTLASIVGLSRLFTTPLRYFAPVALVAITAHVVAWMCRRLRLPLAVSALAVAAGAGLVMSWAILGRTTAYGIPWHGTLHAARLALANAAQAYRTTAAPAAVLPGFTLAGAFGAASAAFLADWAAFRMRATTEACLPSFSLFVLSAALAQGQGEVIAGVAWLIALLAFLLSRQSAVDSPTTAWFASRSRRGPASVLATGGLLIAATAAAAFVIGPTLPGATVHPVFDWRTRTTGGGVRNIGTSPLVDITARLKTLGSTEVFTVRGARPAYWRLTSLDIFNGSGWVLNNVYVGTHGRVPAVGTFTLPESGESTPLVAEVHVTALSSEWLPAPYRAEFVAGTSDISASPDSDSVITNRASSDGDTYTVTSAVPAAAPDQLRNADAIDRSDPTIAHYLQLPSSLNPQVARIAQSVAGGQPTEYDQALALQDWLRSSRFRYSLNVPPDDSPNALVDFLVKTRAGFCQQFAAAFAVMARTLGIPTRVAVGFTQGTLGSDGVYRVTDAQAHAWPEVYFPAYGWIGFEPTPGRGSPDPSAQQVTGVPPGQQSGGGGGTPTTAAPATTPKPSATIPADRSLNNGGTAKTAAKKHHGSPLSPWLVVLAVLIGIPLGWAVLLAGVRTSVRAVRRNGARSPGGEVMLAWKEAREALSTAGAPPLPAETPAEYVARARRVTGLPADAVDALRGLAQTVERTMYAPAPPSNDEAAAAAQSASLVHHALREVRGSGERVLQVLDPRPTFRMVFTSRA